jgi:hypothetical protein
MPVPSHQKVVLLLFNHSRVAYAMDTSAIPPLALRDLRASDGTSSIWLPNAPSLTWLPNALLLTWLPNALPLTWLPNAPWSSGTSDSAWRVGRGGRLMPGCVERGGRWETGGRGGSRSNWMCPPPPLALFPLGRVARACGDKSHVCVRGSARESGCDPSPRLLETRTRCAVLPARLSSSPNSDSAVSACLKGASEIECQP